MDRSKWRKLIKDVQWSGWVWVRECFNAHCKQDVPLRDLFNCLRQVLVEPLHFFLCSCCHWSIHLNQSNVSWFCTESHNDSVANWFISDKRSREFPMNPDCYSWHAVSRSTYCAAIPCCEMPLSILSHPWKPTYINSHSHHLFTK